MIFIIRHGQTDLNKAKALLGRSDVPLNEEGRRQAEEARDRFAAEGIRFAHVYSSPLVRAVDTARIIAEEVPLSLDERLIEMDYGPYEGMDLRSPAPEVLAFFRDFAHHPAPNGMEPLPQVVGRMGAFMEELRECIADLRTGAAEPKTSAVESQTDASEPNILISTHAVAMKGILEYLTPDSQGSYWSKYIGNCAVYTTELMPDGTFSVPQEYN